MKRETRLAIARRAKNIARLTNERNWNRDSVAESIEWLAYSIERVALGDYEEARRLVKIALRELQSL